MRLMSEHGPWRARTVLAVGCALSLMFGFASVARATSATGVAAGLDFSCAVLSTGSVECWGANSGGQLGNGTTTPSLSPVPVAGITNATAVSAGDSEACARLATGRLECWGDNSYGQLGRGGDSSVPGPVSVIQNAVSVAIGQRHACAVLTTGHVDCWGDNTLGQLGDGYNGGAPGSFTPVEATGITDATAVAAGQYHTCVAQLNGHAHCWGDNYYGQLGDGIPSTRPLSLPAAGVTNTFVNTWGSSTPVPVSGVDAANGIGAGWWHSCALLSTGGAQCWGGNGFGQLGDGTTTDRPTQVSVAGLSSATAITGGYYETCALLSGGAIDCWGFNGSGSLGNGQAGGSSSTPVPVHGIDNGAAVAVGTGHACALIATGGVECWGANDSGQLGDGTTTNSSTPVAVAGIP